MDAVTTYLYRSLDLELYMRVPKGSSPMPKATSPRSTLVVGDALKMGLNGHTLATHNLSDQLQIDRICLKRGRAAGRPLAQIP